MAYGITEQGKLVRFDPAAPATAGITMDITGLMGDDETIVGLDFRSAATNMGLYALSSEGKLYSIDPGTGAATMVGTGDMAPMAITGLAAGFDFNPVADRLRVVTGTENRRMHPDTGMVVDGDAAAAGNQVDGLLVYAAGDANFGKTPGIVAAAYTNPDADAATGTTNYAIDHLNDMLVTQGSKEGVTPAVSPNGGMLYTVGALGIDAGNETSFDIRKDGSAWLVVRSKLYQIDLTTGKATDKGTIAAGSLRAFAVAP